MNLYIRSLKTNTILSEWDIYGSAAHGKFAIRQPKEELVYDPLEYDRGSQFYRIVGEKQYHLTDHLGNVRATVSDIKEPSGGGFLTNTITAASFYPFGFMEEGRFFFGGSNRWGFNGMEKDDEIKGAGNSLNTEFRMLDTRTVKWWRQDMVVKEWESPYSSFSGNPIWFADPSGLDTISITGNNGNSIMFEHDSFAKKNFEVPFDIENSSYKNLNQYDVPDAIGIDISIEANAFVSAAGIKASIGDASFVIFTKGYYAFVPYRYLNLELGGGNYMPLKIKDIAGADISIQAAAFAAWWQGDDSDITPESFAGTNTNQSISAAIFQKYGASVGATYFAREGYEWWNDPPEKADYWYGFSFGFGVGIGKSSRLNYVYSKTVSFLLDRYPVKTKELMNSTSGQINILGKHIEMMTGGVFPWTHINNFTNDIKDYLRGN